MVHHNKNTNVFKGNVLHRFIHSLTLCHKNDTFFVFVLMLMALCLWITFPIFFYGSPNILILKKAFTFS